MLEDILHGRESSRSIIILDSLKHFGRTLLKSFTKSLASRVDEVHIFHFDTAPEVFLTGFDDHTKKKLHSHDGWSDPLMWRSPTIPEGSNGKLYLTEPLDLLSYIRKQRQASNGKIGVIIDSLTPVLVHKCISFVVKALYQLCNAAEEDFEMVQSICLIHHDVHEGQVIDMISHVATSTMSLTANASLASFYEEPYGFCKTVHRKANGKVVSKYEGYSVVEDLRLLTFDSSKSTQSNEVSVSTAPDPTANLTFNLSLSAAERQAKSNVVLPYTISQDRQVADGRGPVGSGQIFYQPDEMDDFDDEDPDDDLDV
ncbi:elongator complex protein 5-like [Ptychodera flava]|uniref:elongator complex protein 5-like n=1 Tax=Ptychodera flava TaxID=63121 RepID=UPI003969FC98